MKIYAGEVAMFNNIANNIGYDMTLKVNGKITIKIYKNDDIICDTFEHSHTELNLKTMEISESFNDFKNVIEAYKAKHKTQINVWTILNNLHFNNCSVSINDIRFEQKENLIRYICLDILSEYSAVSISYINKSKIYQLLVFKENSTAGIAVYRPFYRGSKTSSDSLVLFKTTFQKILKTSDYNGLRFIGLTPFNNMNRDDYFNMLKHLRQESNFNFRVETR